MKMKSFLKKIEFGFSVFLIFEICVCMEQNQDGDITEFHFGISSADVQVPEGEKLNGKKARRPKFIDVYTNHPNEEVVENNFYRTYRTKNKSYAHNFRRKHDDGVNTLMSIPNIDQQLFTSPGDDNIESDFGDFESPDDEESDYGNDSPNEVENANLYNDGTKYVYPEHPQFFTQKQHKQPAQSNNGFSYNDDKFVLLQSQMVIPDSENYGSFYLPSNVDDNRPNFWTKVHVPASYQSENYEVVTKPYSFVQKIPHIKKGISSTTVHPTLMEGNSDKYEEIELSQANPGPEEKPKSTKKRINDMLKNYLATLLVERYIKSNKTNGHPVKSNRKLSRFQNADSPKKTPKLDQESKFLYNNIFSDLKNRTITKLKQLFSIFTIVKFQNTECNATNYAGTWQGVCLIPLECTQWHGTALGNCASGYGVCCVFRGSCGDSSRMNCSYFKSPNYPDFYPPNGDVITPTTTTTLAPTTAPTPDPRFYWHYYGKGTGDRSLDNIIMNRQSTSDTLSCIFSVYKANPNIQRFRIDFIDLDLASPTNGTCTDERLVITGQNSNDQIPVICGYNTGQHVYVDVSQLNGPLQIMVLSRTGARKRFKLRICQYTDACTTSQSNCLQYYTGVNGVIQSFNYDQAAMFSRSTPGYFNNLNYAICIRREVGYCSITYTNVANGQTFPFQLVNTLPNGQLTVPAGQAGVDVLNCPDDYIVIDGTRLCGDRFNDGSTTANFSMNAPVVDTSSGPIVINVRTNGNVTGLGFKLYYRQNPCT